MNLFHVIMTAVIASGVVLSLFMALEHITGHPKGRRSWFRFFRGLILSVLIAQMWALGSGLYREHPSIVFLFFTLIYLGGPLEYIRYYTFLNPNKKVPPMVTLSLLPVVPLLLLEVYLYRRPAGEVAASVGRFFARPLDHWLIYVFAASVLVSMTYSSLLLYTEIVSLKQSALKRPLLFSIMLSLLSLASTALCCLYGVTLDPDFILLGASGFSLSFILYFLLKNRFPDFFRVFVREVKLQRYRRTLLKGLDNGAINERLSELMREEKLYRTMDLRMKDVAERLLITPHQFSQLLNEHIKTDFRNFVNRYRVEEAMALLAGDPTRSIISICFDVGFNSKTSFNITFKKMTGLSPKEYRERTCAAGGRAFPVSLS
ncbi:MAG: AraC family transcriptional regulator [Spirochaetes bacterium]|nr:AraC family transcriptional regulator [Spirochaetota bacterium]